MILQGFNCDCLHIFDRILKKVSSPTEMAATVMVHHPEATGNSVKK